MITLESLWCKLQKLNAVFQKLTLKVDEPKWHYVLFWGEESGALASNSREWSFGDGGTGAKGIPVKDGTQITELFFHADTFGVNAQVSIEVQDIQDVTSPVVLGTISLNGASDGGGTAHNAYKLITHNINVPANCVIGFQTIVVSGTVRDARVGVKLRFKEVV